MGGMTGYSPFMQEFNRLLKKFRKKGEGFSTNLREYLRSLAVKGEIYSMVMSIWDTFEVIMKRKPAWVIENAEKATEILKEKKFGKDFNDFISTNFFKERMQNFQNLFVTREESNDDPMRYFQSILCFLKQSHLIADCCEWNLEDGLNNSCMGKKLEKPERVEEIYGEMKEAWNTCMP